MRASIFIALAAALVLAACESKETKIYQQPPPPQPAPTIVVPSY